MSISENTSSENIWWGPVNKKVDKNIFDILYKKVINYYNKNDDTNTYIFDGLIPTLIANFFVKFEFAIIKFAFSVLLINLLLINVPFS